MESITKGTRHDPMSPLGRKRGNSIRKNRRSSIVNPEVNTMDNSSDFQIKPRRISIKKNSVAL
jgi:hypothetical protein